jgi:probable rRNA maturation factor
MRRSRAGTARGEGKGTRAKLRVSVVDERGRSIEPRLARWLAGVAPARARGVVNVALVSDAVVRRLNRTYRGKDQATDVLSFPADKTRTQRIQRSRRNGASTAFVSSVPFVSLGDVVIARGVARRQAREARHSELTELRVLALHGLLHLLGYDHEQDDGRMRRAEERLRRKGGLDNGLIGRTGA